MKLPHTIVVPLDGTSHATVALVVARTLCEVTGATIHIVHVRDRVLPTPALVEEIGLEGVDLRGTVLDQIEGGPSAGIVELAARFQPAFIVMCTHTGMPKPSGILGHVAADVLRDASCPSVFVRPERGHAPWNIHQILIPYDGTPSTAAALESVAALAERTAAKLQVLYVAAPGAPPPAEAGSITPPFYIDQPQHEWPAWAIEFLDRLCCERSFDPERLRLSVARGEIGSEIVRFASEQRTDLIALAWAGRFEPHRARTLRTVLGRAGCPMMVVRT